MLPLRRPANSVVTPLSSPTPPSPGRRWPPPAVAMAAPPNFPPTLAGRLPRGAAPRDPVNPNPRPSSPARGSPQDLLFHAAFDGNLRLVKKMVRELGGDEGRGAEMVRFMRDGNGLGPLHIAAARAKLPVCRYLVEELRLDVNSISEAGLTPLTCAIDGGSVDVVRYLLDNGSDTETLICTGLTPLVYAVGKGNCEIVQALLNKGAYIDALTTVGAALHFAAHNGRDDMVKILLDNHADHNKIAYGANQPLIYMLELLNKDGDEVFFERFGLVVCSASHDRTTIFILAFRRPRSCTGKLC